MSLTAFRDRQIADYVRRILAERPISAIYIFSGQMGQYVPASFTGRVVMDLVDVDSAKFEAYGAAGSGARAWIDRREAGLLAREEKRLTERSDVTFLVSDAEAELFRSRLPDALGTKVATLGNGIDTTFFDPAAITGNDPFAGLSGPHLTFTGQMDYAPNIAAAERLADCILPLVRTEFPHAACHIVGRNPPRDLLARHGWDGCHVWGEVADIRPYLTAADIVAVPLELARGVQNKVLEAMAMGRPVVLTAQAAAGIGGKDGVEFAIGDSDADFAAHVIALLRDDAGAKAMGVSSRSFVVEHRTWSAMLGGLEAAIGFGSASLNSNGQRDAA